MTFVMGTCVVGHNITLHKFQCSPHGAVHVGVDQRCGQLMNFKRLVLTPKLFFSSFSFLFVSLSMNTKRIHDDTFQCFLHRGSGGRFVARRCTQWYGRWCQCDQRRGLLFLFLLSFLFRSFGCTMPLVLLFFHCAVLGGHRTPSVRRR